jgi:hypothetical protein
MLSHLIFGSGVDPSVKRNSYSEGHARKRCWIPVCAYDNSGSFGDRFPLLQSMIKRTPDLTHDPLRPVNLEKMNANWP